MTLRILGCLIILGIIVGAGASQPAYALDDNTDTPERVIVAPGAWAAASTARGAAEALLARVNRGDDREELEAAVEALDEALSDSLTASNLDVFFANVNDAAEAIDEVKSHRAEAREIARLLAGALRMAAEALIETEAAEVAQLPEGEEKQEAGERLEEAREHCRRGHDEENGDRWGAAIDRCRQAFGCADWWRERRKPRPQVALERFTDEAAVNAAVTEAKADAQALLTTTQSRRDRRHLARAIAALDAALTRDTFCARKLVRFFNRLRQAVQAFEAVRGPSRAAAQGIASTLTEACRAATAKFLENVEQAIPRLTDTRTREAAAKALAKSKNDYARGIAAIAAGRHGEAFNCFRQAIKRMVGYPLNGMVIAAPLPNIYSDSQIGPSGTVAIQFGRGFTDAPNVSLVPSGITLLHYVADTWQSIDLDTWQWYAEGLLCEDKERIFGLVLWGAPGAGATLKAWSLDGSLLWQRPLGGNGRDGNWGFLFPMLRNHEGFTVWGRSASGEPTTWIFDFTGNILDEKSGWLPSPPPARVFTNLE